ncbi:hypothetical protein HDV06_006658 [Boothiomyces sp. JEL0866]|nr:hypothetical protein HDV06_006658 [Boothiomyces sp. JEL0866]
MQQIQINWYAPNCQGLPSSSVSFSGVNPTALSSIASNFTSCSLSPKTSMTNCCINSANSGGFNGYSSFAILPLSHSSRISNTTYCQVVNGTTAYYLQSDSCIDGYFMCTPLGLYKYAGLGCKSTRRLQASTFVSSVPLGFTNMWNACYPLSDCLPNYTTSTQTIGLFAALIGAVICVFQLVSSVFSKKAVLLPISLALLVESLFSVSRMFSVIHTDFPLIELITAFVITIYNGITVGTSFLVIIPLALGIYVYRFNQVLLCYYQLLAAATAVGPTIMMIKSTNKFGWVAVLILQLILLVLFYVAIYVQNTGLNTFGDMDFVSIENIIVLFTTIAGWFTSWLFVMTFKANNRVEKEEKFDKKNVDERVTNSYEDKTVFQV